MMASPPACKPMKPTGWKRARRAYASERILGALVFHLVEKYYGFRDLPAIKDGFRDLPAIKGT